VICADVTGSETCTVFEAGEVIVCETKMDWRTERKTHRGLVFPVVLCQCFLSQSIRMIELYL
jgi:hypothetical protein